MPAFDPIASPTVRIAPHRECIPHSLARLVDYSLVTKKPIDALLTRPGSHN